MPTKSSPLFTDEIIVGTSRQFVRLDYVADGGVIERERERGGGMESVTR